MEFLFAALAIVLFGWAITIPARRYEKRTGKKLGRSGAASAMHAMKEVFQPSAANASLIIEEQREARVAIPTPGDKPIDRNHD